MIVGITGKARHGKSECGKYLVEQHGYTQLSFAEPIRTFMINFLDLKGGLQELDDIKEIPHQMFNGKTPRYVMQKMGTDFMRDMIWGDVWVNRCIEMAKKYDNVVISDVRFDNEAQAIVKAGGVIINVIRPDVEIQLSNHASEAGISREYIQYNILNDRTVEDLQFRLGKYLGSL